MSNLDLSQLSVSGIQVYLARKDILASRQMLLLRMAVAVKGGMTPEDCLDAIADAEEHNNREAHAFIYKQVEGKLRSGEFAVHEALDSITTVDDRCFLYAEDKVKDLGTLLQLAYDTSIRREKLVSAIAKPFTMPLYLLVMTCGILIVGGTVMLPNFTTLLPIKEWEYPSRVVYSIGQFLLKYWPVFALCLVAVLGWVSWSMANLTNEFRNRYLDRVFPWSVYKSLQSSSFILNLAAMFKAKVPILDAVKGYEHVSAPYASSFANLMRRRLESEQTASDMHALDVGFIDRNTMDSMRILNNKLPTDAVISTIGEAAFELLAAEVTTNASRISRLVTLVLAAFLLFSLYGMMSVIPAVTEKTMSSSRR